jgi:hypothetical protein
MQSIRYVLLLVLKYVLLLAAIVLVGFLFDQTLDKNFFYFAEIAQGARTNITWITHQSDSTTNSMKEFQLSSQHNTQWMVEPQDDTTTKKR